MAQTAPPRARSGDVKEKEYWWKQDDGGPESCRIKSRPGHACPSCGKGVLAYDGLFVLTCDCCGFVAESGASW